MPRAHSGRILILALSLVAAMLATSPTSPATSAARATPGLGIIERADVVYGSAVNVRGVRQKLRLDLLLPPGTGARPAVVLAHGGGFRRGSRKDRRIRRVARRLAAHGYVTASVSYRLRPRSSGNRAGAARDAQHDLQAAVRYLKRYRARLGVDRRRIVVLGSSAGGIAALRAAFNPEQPGRSGNRGYGSRVAAVVSLWGATNPRMIERGAPPALMFHGRADTTVPFRLGRRTCRATRHRGNVCRNRWWWREGHAAWHRTDEIVTTTRRFLNRRLG